MIWAMTLGLLIAMLCVAVPVTVWAEPPADADAKAPEEGRDDAAETPEQETAEQKEFHLDLKDVKDLRDADIVLPEIDEGDALPAEGQDEGDGKENPEELDLKIEKPEEEQEKEKIDPVKLVQEIIEGMDDSAVRLADKKDPGKETQGVQKKVVDDLSELIEYVKQQQAQQQQSQQSQSQQSQQDQQRARRRQRQRQQRQRQQQGRQSQRPQRATNPMQDEFATKGSVQEEDLEEVSKLLEQRWGDLLKNAPKETLQAIPNMILPKYADLLNRYFYALARQAAEETGDE